MNSIEEPKSYFGGMAAGKWNSSGNFISDPPEECSWLFKIEIEKNKYISILFNNQRFSIY